jgi:hypothetical protein
MNACGLMELVLLSIALQRGVITGTTYALLVMMTPCDYVYGVSAL